MGFRNDTYTGGEHYWIRLWNGQCEVRKEGYVPELTETLFKGNYEQCENFIENLLAENYEYDMGI